MLNVIYLNKFVNTFLYTKPSPKSEKCIFLVYIRFAAVTSASLRSGMWKFWYQGCLTVLKYCGLLVTAISFF